MRLKGRITQWQDARGFGFIQPALGGEQVFVHIRDISSSRRPAGGETVTYELKRDAKGRMQATNVYISGAHQQPKPKPSSSHYPPMLAAGMLALVTALAATERLPVFVPLAYAALSVITFFAYWQDKWAARQNAWRTPESSLLMLGLFGGWPGGVLAQRTLRHKSSKHSFQVQFWITVILNCGALLWLVMNPDQLP